MAMTSGAVEVVWQQLTSRVALDISPGTTRGSNPTARVEPPTTPTRIALFPNHRRWDATACGHSQDGRSSARRQTRTSAQCVQPQYHPRRSTDVSRRAHGRPELSLESKQWSGGDHYPETCLAWRTPGRPDHLLSN